ncbi:site-specific integrase [Deinococcus sedimenti]|uniref:Site-specific integrase n=1 Tax=Deinococcus sedimenti TaxID=1867090 RepID=A0ABQ2S9M2_9DEIO|nr:site-specific integrase [Deinococcus sedimenti]GGS05602.1 site-specific integrase [Deinococcus sedimenti]
MPPRRRAGEGTVHPIRWNGRIVSYRGLASYVDPVTGKQRRRSVSRATRAEAERALKDLQRTLPQVTRRRARTATPPTLPPASDPTSLHAYLLRWLTYKERDVRPSTYRLYVIALQPVVPVLGATPLTEVTVLGVEELVRVLHRERGPQGAGRSLHILRMALRQAVRWQLVPANAAQDVRKPRVVRPETLVWTPTQAARFLQAASTHRLYPLFVLALSTGLRRGELLALHWGDVDLDGREITVRHNLVKDATGHYAIGAPKTDAGHRRVLLAEDVVGILRAHRRLECRGRRSPRPDDLVFTAASGQHVQGRHLDRTYRALTEQAGVPRIRFHDLRHTAASLLMRRGVPPKVVADRLGHADASFTLKVYTHVYDDQRAAAALPLSELLNAPEQPRIPVSSRDQREAGLDALRELHEALGRFLARAPDWAQAALSELMQPRT